MRALTSICTLTSTCMHSHPFTHSRPRAHAHAHSCAGTHNEGHPHIHTNSHLDMHHCIHAHAFIHYFSLDNLIAHLLSSLSSYIVKSSDAVLTDPSVVTPSVLKLSAFLSAYLSDVMLNFTLSQSACVFSFLEISSVSRAVEECSLPHLQYLQRSHIDLDGLVKGRAAFHLGVNSGRVSILWLLKACGASVNVQVRGVVSVCERERERKCVRVCVCVCIAYIAEIFPQDAGGNTPLHVACRSLLLSLSSFHFYLSSLSFLSISFSYDLF